MPKHVLSRKKIWSLGEFPQCGAPWILRTQPEWRRSAWLGAALIQPQLTQQRGRKELLMQGLIRPFWLYGFSHDRSGIILPDDWHQWPITCDLPYRRFLTHHWQLWTRPDGLLGGHLSYQNAHLLQHWYRWQCGSFSVLPCCLLCTVVGSRWRAMCSSEYHGGYGLNKRIRGLHTDSPLAGVDMPVSLLRDRYRCLIQLVGPSIYSEQRFWRPQRFYIRSTRRVYLESL